MAIIHHPSSVVDSMYTIDLLKGEGVPIRSRPGGIAVACLVIVIPLLLGLGLASVYMDGRVIVSIQRQELNKLEATAGALSEALKRKEALDRDKALAIDRLSEIRTGLDGYTQWSPILAALVENLSDTLTLTRLEARREITRRRIPSKENPANQVDVSVPLRTLRLSVCGRPAGGTSHVARSLQEDLRSSPVIGPILDTIAVSQHTALLGGEEAVTYELECVFKTKVQ